MQPIGCFILIFECNFMEDILKISNMEGEWSLLICVDLKEEIRKTILMDEQFNK